MVYYYCLGNSKVSGWLLFHAIWVIVFFSFTIMARTIYIQLQVDEIRLALSEHAQMDLL